jgi:hypothetical protein
MLGVVCRNNCFGTGPASICGKCGDALCEQCFKFHPCAVAARFESRVPLVVKSSEEDQWRQKKSV